MKPVAPLVAFVDDDASVRKAMSRLIRSAGMRVETYASGMEFLVKVRERRPSCVVLDLHMPYMDGFDVYYQLVENDIALPVIMVTGHDTSETCDRATDVGVAAYLRKPVDDEALLEAIARCVGVETPV